MPSAHKTAKKWEAINGAALPGLTAITIPEPVVSYDSKSEGAWLYLEGATVTLTEGSGKRSKEYVYEVHFTITKPPTKSRDSDEWHLVHVTVRRAGSCHVFYDVDHDGTYSLTTSLLNRDGGTRNGSEHYNNAQINDPALVNAIDHDVKLIFRYLVS